MPPDTTIVFPKPGVTVYLPGGTRGFTAVMAEKLGGVPMHPDHAKVLAAHVMTAPQKEAFAAQQKALAEKEAPDAAGAPSDPA